MSGSAATGAGPIAICLVESREEVRDELVAVFQWEGFEVVAAVGTAQDGEGAIVAYRPSLALIDHRLAGGSGIDLCRRLRVAVPEVPLILYTPRISSADEYFALGLGVAAVVVKNLRTDELVAAIREHAAPRRPDTLGWWHG